jgi:hypothetical protein
VVDVRGAPVAVVVEGIRSGSRIQIGRGDRGFQRIQVVVQHDGRALALVVEHEERMHMMVSEQMKLLDILLVNANNNLKQFRYLPMIDKI